MLELAKQDRKVVWVAENLVIWLCQFHKIMDESTINICLRCNLFSVEVKHR